MKTEHFRRILFSLPIYLISFYGGPTGTIAAAILGSPPSSKVQLNITHLHLDQQLDQTTHNQTEAKPDLPSSQQAPVNSSGLNLARQDVGQAVGENVGDIITGVLGGGLTTIFQGSSSFIGDMDVKQNVDFVLNNVAPPFETVLKYGFNGIKNYFGIGQTTVKTVLVTQAPEQQLLLQPIIYDNGTVEFIPIYHTVTKAPIVVTVTSPPVTTGTSLLEEIDVSNIDVENSVAVSVIQNLLDGSIDRITG